jgi:multidrug efflux system membrane fusion protein
MSDPLSQPAPPQRFPDEPPKKAAGMSYLIWTVVVILLVLVGIILWRHHGQSQQASVGGRRGGAGLGPIAVSVETAKKGGIGIYINDLGVVTPLKTVSISSRIQGQITAVRYQEGQMVKAGDPLIEIDAGPNQAALIQAEGELERDKAILENAKLDLQRYQEAYSKNAIAKQILDTQGANVHQDEGIVKLDEGVLTNAQVQLDYCHITAPVSGRVGLRLVDEGNMVQANGTTPLVVITVLQPITVIFNVAEDDLPQILEQLRAGKTLTVDAFDRAQTKKLATGTLETLDNQIDPASGTVKFRALFTNGDESLFPNQFVNARLLVKTLENATILTNTVIQRNADNAFVYLLKPDQTVAMQTITAGTTDGNVTAVEGIDAGTVVVADNFNKLTDGAKVTVRPPGNTENGTNSMSGAAGGHHHHQDTSQ